MSFDQHLAAAAAAAQQLEAHIAALERQLVTVNAERDKTVEEWEARYETLRTQRREKLTPGDLKARHRNLKRDISQLRADAELADDSNLLKKIAGLDRPADPFIERERELDQREQAIAERETPKSKPRMKLFKGR